MRSAPCDQQSVAFCAALWNDGYQESRRHSSDLGPPVGMRSAEKYAYVFLLGVASIAKPKVKEVTTTVVPGFFFLAF